MKRFPPLPRAVAFVPALIAIVLALATSGSRVEAQSFTGVFVAADQAGGVITLALRETGGGRVTGSLTWSREYFQVEAFAEDGVATGTARGSTGALHFEGERWDDELTVLLFGMDAEGLPVYDDYSEIDFVLQTRDPMSGRMRPGSPIPRTGLPSSPGASAPRARPGAGRPGAPEAGRAGARPDASRIGAFVPGRTTTGRDLAPGFTEDHPLVDEWVDFLGGTRILTTGLGTDGSGGPTGRSEIYLCSDRSFAVRDERALGFSPGGRTGARDGFGSETGTWYVITDGRVVGLVLEDLSGGLTELRLDQLGRQTWANGRRVDVTPTDQCR